MRIAANKIGLNLRTGYHRKNPLTPEESKYYGVLWDHVGEENAVSAADLAELSDLSGREVRAMHNHMLFDHNLPVLSAAGPKGGYWIAENEGEARQFYDAFRRRGLTGLVKASRGKQSAMVDMVTQLSFEFEDLVDQTAATPMIRPLGGRPLPVDVVDAFLEKMTGDPEKFADGLRKIREKYGAVLLPRERVRAMQVQAAKLSAMVASLG